MALAHYRIYELDPADHILVGYSVMCRSDAAALVAARRVGEQHAAAVEVWESARRVAYLNVVDVSEGAAANPAAAPDIPVNNAGA